MSGQGSGSPLASVALVLFSVALFAILSLMAKLLGTDALGEPLHPLQISAARFMVAFLGLCAVLPFRPISFRGIPWGLHARRSIAGWCGVSALFAAAIVIPLADATAISFLSILIAMVLSVLWLGEKSGPRRWIAAGIALLGALLITRPGTSAFQPAALIAVMAAVFIGFEIVFIKQLSGREPVMRILFVNNLIGSAISAAVILFVWQAPSGLQWLFIVGIGLMMILVQTSNIMAMQRADAGFVAPFWYATPAFAAVYDWLAFDHLVDTLSASGIAMIIAAGAFISWREHRSKQHQA